MGKGGFALKYDMAVIMDQPNFTNDYLDPLTGFVMGMGFEEELPSVKRMDVIFQDAGVDHRGLCYWNLRVDDFETGRTMATAQLNEDGVCLINRMSMDGKAHPIAKIQLALATMYSYEYPFAYLRPVDQPTPMAEFNRKAWGIWIHSTDGREVASYVMSTSEQCRLCCVGTVTGHDYEMVFTSEGGHVAEVKNDLLGDRLYSLETFNSGTGPIDRTLAKILYNPDTDAYGRTLCMMTLISLGCYNVVTFFNPKSAPPKRRKRRR